MKHALFILPLTMFIGTAGQAAGLVFFAILGPFLSYGRFYPGAQENKPILESIFWLVSIWLIFPLMSFLNYFIHETPPDFPSKLLFKSHIPSSFAISCLGLLVLLPLRSKVMSIDEYKKKAPDPQTTFRYFVWGVFIGSALLFL